MLFFSFKSHVLLPCILNSKMRIECISDTILNNSAVLTINMLREMDGLKTPRCFSHCVISILEKNLYASALSLSSSAGRSVSALQRSS